MIYKCACCYVDANYIEPAIVSINSFRRFNPNIHLIVGYESGMNVDLLSAAVGNDVEFRAIDVPNHQIVIFSEVGKNNRLFSLFVPDRRAMSAYAARIMMLSELKNEFDVILNFDLDTIFCGSVNRLLQECTPAEIYGVSERENRNRWMTKLNLKEIITSDSYINTGLVVYGANAIQDLSIYDYFDFLKKFPDDIYCPEQDYINYRYSDKIRNIPSSYNLMFTDRNYRCVSPVMIHFVGLFKPWSDSRAIDGADYYFGKYLSEVRKNAEYITDEFMKKIQKNVNFSNL